MKAIIIEDEWVASQSLQKLIHEVDVDIEVTTVLQTIEESVEWMQTNKMPDLIFMDIHLADGSAFAIFEKVEINCPIVFTTAYDEYALKAFEVSSIDYLLKPISKNDLIRAINKYKSLKNTDSNIDNKNMIDNLLSQLNNQSHKYKKCFLVPERDKLIPLNAENIACIFIDTKTVKAITLDRKVFFMSQTLDELIAQLDPQFFFRANRQFIISRDAIKDISLWFGNKLSLNLKVETPEKVIVSKARVPEFKSWLSESSTI
jgi:Response regulator of the LytR/AlgR family